MSEFKNMKIPFENNLDEIVVELERLGYVCWAWQEYDLTAWVFTWTDGDYTNTEDLDDIDHDCHTSTTLTELKEMK